MPQITFEYSANIDIANQEEIIHRIHHILVEHLPTELKSCKTRIIKHSHFLIGDGLAKYSFLNLSISVIKGRKKEVLELIANNISLYLTLALKRVSNPDLQVSVSINELPEIYIKS